MSSALRPGLLVLHGNRLERLAETLFAWLQAHPLAPLEEETLLVQSNGMAEWLKMELASAQGICAATRVELPARFIWRAYRALLGRAAVPAVSPLDKLPLTWRLMGLLPALARDPIYAPVAGFLAEAEAGAGDATRRLQLAQRLADLFDQYQVYRGDWLQDWAAGRDQLRGAAASQPVAADQTWQPALWRALLAGLAPPEQQATRPLLQQRFLAALHEGRQGAGLPRRIVLFGITQLPQQTLQAVAALSTRAQVLMAVPNPCRYHWADTIDGRELLRAAGRRHPLRKGRDLAQLPLADMHAHGHPLLSAWGRQSRDFVRQLDEFDDLPQARERDALPRVDLFDDGPGASLLQQVQARIRDLVPLAEHAELAAATPLPEDDRSLVFHIAHSAQREVEILHDQLLHLLAHPPGGRQLHPRDIVVMVPDIDGFAPAIRAVFGQFDGPLGRSQARHLPWSLADQRDRGQQPLLVALEWLLHAPQPRCSFSELRDLLDVPAVARRFGLAAADLPTLVDWAAGAGVRWGLHADHRAQLGLQACGDANSWHFGLQRMLLGYATGELDQGHAGIEPQAEVGGLSAGLVGVLAELLQALTRWWVDAVTPRRPHAWGERLRALLQAMFAAEEATELALLAALDDALGAWLLACENAGFDEPLELAAVREAWLGAADDPAALAGGRRFRAGGVTFCTLLPMRAIPFEVVCLLGMNEGDYPRRGERSDFDLMALPGQARPGDRSRRDDDRQLMLDALLSARRVFYLSWVGRSQRDNQPQAPSVLVSQLRDYLAAGWGPQVLPARTTEHPLQPFSRSYFERPPATAGGGLFTYASEWRSAHGEWAATPRPPAAVTPSAPAAAVDIEGLAAFLRNPVKAFFRQRMRVSFDPEPVAVDDDESFVSAGLERWQLQQELLHRAGVEGDDAAAPERLSQAVAGLRRAGRLPMAGPGDQVQAELLRGLQPMLAYQQALLAAHPRRHDKLHLHLSHAGPAGLLLDDWLPGLRSSGAAGETPLWTALQAGKLADRALKSPRADKLLPAWLRGLAAAARGQPVRGVLVASDAVLSLAPPEPADARAVLFDLLQAWREGLGGSQPLPTAVRTGLAWLSDSDRARDVFEGSGDFGSVPGEGREACLARLYPDFETLRADPLFEPASQRLYAPFLAWLKTGVTVAALPGRAEADEATDE